MSIARLLLPLTLPLGVLVVGSWRLAVSPDLAPPPKALAAPISQHRGVAARPDYARTPPIGGSSCSTNPSIAEGLLQQGRRLGIAVVAGPPELPGKDASYRAEPGRLGTITLKPRPMSAEVRCLLISHEFIHVLQHLYGDLRGVPPLGWSITEEQVARFGSSQEAEAYAHQHAADYVLELLKATPRPRR